MIARRGGVPAFALLLVAALAAACAAGPAGSSPGAAPGSASEAPPTASPAAGSPPAGGADLAGTLGGDAELEGGCAWVLGDDGERYEVIYPDGWQVQANPVQLRDPDGQVVAAEGDPIALMGEVDDTLISICQVGPIFRATAVIVDD